MIAAIYARKSTEQNGVGDEEKSVTRQIEHAKAYATKKGWTVHDESIYVDDGISGAEFVKRPGFLRLMNALKPKPAFQVLVMSEESRLGREQIETAYALKQIMDAGVRVFFYLEDCERTLDSGMDKVMLSLTNFAAEMEREKAWQRTHDALRRKALAGHVAGGAVYGYRNVEVLGDSGQRAHVRREIEPDQAAVIVRTATPPRGEPPNPPRRASRRNWSGSSANARGWRGCWPPGRPSRASWTASGLGNASARSWRPSGRISGASSARPSGSTRARSARKSRRGVRTGTGCSPVSPRRPANSSGSCSSGGWSGRRASTRRAGWSTTTPGRPRTGASWPASSGSNGWCPRGESNTRPRV
jgi:DNA invertase Pin-like site-specific DNA recombinase